MAQIKMIITKEQRQNTVHAKGKAKTYVEFRFKTIKSFGKNKYTSKPHNNFVIWQR